MSRRARATAVRAAPSSMLRCSNRALRGAGGGDETVDAPSPPPGLRQEPELREGDRA